MESRVFQYIGQSVDATVTAFVEPAAGALIGSMQGLAVIGVGLYLLITGIQVVIGTIQTPAKTFLVHVIKIVAITAFALNVDNYGTYVIGFFQALEVGLADALNVGAVDAANIYQVLDDVVGQGAALIKKCQDMAGESAWYEIHIKVSWMGASIMIGLGTIAVVVLGGAGILVAKFGIAILFAVGPIFVLALLFPITARFFDSWFSMTMNYTMIVIIVSVILSFAIAAFGSAIERADLSGEGVAFPLLVGVEVLIIACVMCFFIYQAYGMAAGLAGGMAMSALTWRHLATPGRLLNPQSTRRDLQSGMMTTAGALNHIVAGNTLINPAYSQNLVKNGTRNWGRMNGGSIKQGS